MQETVIQLVLFENRIFPNLKGYKYCFEALKIMLIKDFPLKTVYETVGKKYNIKANSIEKSVSNAISKAFLAAKMQEKYGNLCFFTGKINNKAFLNILKTQILSHKNNVARI